MGNQSSRNHQPSVDVEEGGLVTESRSGPGNEVYMETNGSAFEKKKTSFSTSRRKLEESILNGGAELDERKKDLENFPKAEEREENAVTEDAEMEPEKLRVQKMLSSLTQNLKFEQTKQDILKRSNDFASSGDLSKVFKDPVNGQTVLFLIAQELEVEDVRSSVEQLELEVWTRNPSDGKLPLHAAVVRNHAEMSSYILGVMKDKAHRNTLQGMVCGLILDTILHAVPVEKKGKSHNHHDCLEVLLRKDGNFNEHLQEDKRLLKFAAASTSLPSLLVKIGDVESQRMLEESSNARFLLTGKEPPPLTWREAKLYLLNDKIEGLEVRLSEFSFEINKYLRPKGAPQNKTLYHLAVELCAPKCLEFLLKKTKNSSLIDEPDRSGCPALHSVTSIKVLFALDALGMLLKNGAFINAQDNDGNTLLHKVAMNIGEESSHFLEIVKVLLDNVNLSLTCTNIADLTPIEILEFRMKENSEQKLVVDLHHLISAKIEQVENIYKAPTYIDLLRDTRAGRAWNFDVNEVPPEVRSRLFIGSKTVLYLSVLKLKRTCVQLFINEGHDPWKRNADDGKMALHAALSIGDHTLVQDLIRQMKKLTRAEKLNLSLDSFSLLQSVLCNYDHEDESYQKCLEVLLTKDIILDITQKGRNGLNAADLALGMGLTQALSVLTPDLFNHGTLPSCINHKEGFTGAPLSKLKSILEEDDDVSLVEEISVKERNTRWRLRQISRHGTLLHEAVKHQSVNCVRSVVQRLTHPMDIDIPDSYGRTPLHLAVDLGTTEVSFKLLQIARILVRSGASVNARDINGSIPLHHLAQRCINVPVNGVGIFRQILETILFEKDLCPNVENCNGETVLEALPKPGDFSECLQGCVDEDLVKLFERLFSEIVEDKTPNDSLVLDLEGFIVASKYDLLEKTVSKYRNLLRKEGSQKLNRYVGTKPILHIITKHFSPENLKIALDLGMNPWISSTDNQEIALHVALRRGNPDIVAATITSMKERCTSNEMNHITKHSFSLLKTIICSRNASSSRSSDSNHDECLHIFVNSGLDLDVNQKLNSNGPSLLDLAVKCGYAKGRQILEKMGATRTSFACGYDPFLLNKFSKFLLNDERDKLDIEIVMRGNVLTPEILRPEGSVHQKTILHLAVELEAQECLEVLLNKMTSPSQLDEPDKNGCTPLHYAVERAKQKNSHKILACMRMLVDHGAWVSCLDANMNTPLHILSSTSTEEFGVKTDAYFHVLLDHSDVNLEYVNQSNETPMATAPQHLKQHFQEAKSKSVSARNKELWREFYLALMTSDKNMLEQSFQRIFQNPQLMPESVYFGNKSLLFCLTEILDYYHLEYVMKNWTLDPWLRNPGDGKIALHAALVNGDLPVAHFLVEEMKKKMEGTQFSKNQANHFSKNRKVNLKAHSASLLGKIFLNHHPLSPRDRTYSPIGCLKRLLEPDVIIDVNASCEYLENMTPLDIAYHVEWPEAVAALIESGARKSETRQQVPEDLDKLLMALQKDDRDSMELQCALHRHKFQYEPETLPQNDLKTSILHEAVSRRSKECLRFMLNDLVLLGTLNIPDINGWTPLHYAVEDAALGWSTFGLECVKRYLEKGADVNARDENGNSPLHTFVATVMKSDHVNEEGSLRCLSLLLDHEKTDVLALNGSLKSPLDKFSRVVTKAGSFEAIMCQKLLDCGAVVPEADQSRLIKIGLFVPSQKRRSGKHVHQWEVLNKIISKEFDQILPHMEASKDSIANQYVGTKSILYLCLESLAFETIESFIRSGVDPWIRNIKDGKLPLHAALERGNVRVVEILLDSMKHANQSPMVDLRKDTFSIFQTLLCNAKAENTAEEGSNVDHLACLDLLTSPLCLLDLNQQSRTALCSMEELVSWIHNEEIESFLRKRTQLKLLTNSPATNSQRVPGFIELIRILKRDDRDRLEIEIAKCGNDLTTAIYLPDERSCQTIFHAAVKESATDCLQYLVHKNTDLMKLSLPDEKGMTPLHWAVQIAAEGLTTASVACLKLLLLNGAFVNARENHGESPLHLLVRIICEEEHRNQDGFLTCLECLLKMRTIHKDARNNYKQTPAEILEDHFERTDPSIHHIKQLLTQKSDFDVRRVTGRKITKEQVYEILCDALSVNPCTLQKTSDLIKMISSWINPSRVLLNRYIGRKTLLFCAVEKSDSTLIDLLIRCGCDPWQRNIGDGKIPLHAALVKANVIEVALILQHMKQKRKITHKLPLENMSFGLLQACLTSSSSNRHAGDCLRELLKHADIDGNQLLNFDEAKFITPLPVDLKVNILTLASWSSNIEAELLLQQYGAALPLSFNLLDEYKLKWDHLAEILEVDDTASLDLEIIRHRKNMARLLRVSDAPRKQTLVHASVFFGATECLKIIKNLLTPLELDEPDEDGRTPLHYAVELGFVTQIPTYLLCMSILLEGGANVNCRDANGDTIFHNILQMDLALRRNPTKHFVSCLEYLLNSRNVYLNAVNDSGVALKDIRISFDSKEKRLLYRMICEKAEQTSSTVGECFYDDVLKNGAFSTKKKSRLTKRVEIPKGYMGSKTILYLLAASKSLSLVDQALNDGHDPWKTNVDDARLPLHSALESGIVYIVERLLKSMKRDWRVEQMNQLGFSLIQSVFAYASRPGTKVQVEDSNHLACFTVLLAYLAEVHPVDTASGKVTVFDLVCGHGLEQFRSLLQQKFPTQLHSNGPAEPLEASKMIKLLTSDDVESLQIEFLRRGDQFTNMLYPDKVTHGENILHLAAEYQAERCFKFLLDKCPSTNLLDLPDEDGFTVLHYAVELSAGKQIPCLKNWVESSEESENFGPAAFMTEELVRRGAFLDARDQHGNTALHRVASQCKNRTYLETLFLQRILHALLDGAEADIDPINDTIKTPLDMLESDVTDEKNSVLVCSKILCEHGAFVSNKLEFQLNLHFKKIQQIKKRAKRSEFSELLHFIFSKDEPSIKQLLKKSKKKVFEDWETRYIGDRLTLYFFIDQFDHEMVECFLTFGGSPWIEDGHGNIPLNAALSNGDFKTSEVLLKSMKESRDTEVLDLSPRSFSLFSCLFKNMTRIEKPVGVNYYTCIERLLQQDVLVNMSGNTLELCAETGDLEAMRLVSRAEPLQWSEVVHILRNNDTERLELELQKVGHRTELIMRPRDAPDGLTTLHAAFDFSLKENNACFDILLESIHSLNSRFPLNFHNQKPRVNLINEPDSRGATVLHKAVHNLASKKVEKLLELGADVNARDNLGDSPLHLLTQKASNKHPNDWERTADALLASDNIDVDAINEASETPTHWGSPASLKLRAKIKEMHSNNDDAGEKKCLLSKIYNCCFAQNFGGFRAVFDSSPLEEQIIINQYIGSQTILHHILSLADDALLAEFLEFGCDPWQKNVEGDLPLSVALHVGFEPNVNLLIQTMKKTKNQRYIDLTDQSFRYLNILLTSTQVTDNHSVDHTKCLKRLLEDDVLLDINAVDTSGDGLNALEVATVVSNQEAIRMLLAKGSFIGTKRTVNGRVGEGILSAILPETLRFAMNDCVNVQNSELYSNTDVAHPQFKLKLDCSFLLPPREGTKSLTKDHDQNTTRFKVAKTVLEIGEDLNHQDSLQLPLMEALLEAKWNSIFNIIVVNAFLTCLFLLLTITQCIFINLNLNFTVDNAHDPSMLDNRTAIYAIGIPLTVLAAFLALKEALELITSFRSYFRRLENYIEWFLISSSVILSFADLDTVATVHLSAWTVLIAFYELLLAGEHVITGHYIGKFRYTVRNIGRYFAWFTVPMLASGVSLWFLYAPSGVEPSLSHHIAQMYAMTLGDFDQFLGQDSMQQDSWVSFSFLMYFLVFFLMVNLAQLILITAMTISDVGAFTTSVQFHAKRSKWKVIARYEDAFDTIISCRNLLRKSFVTRSVDAFLRRFQQPNHKKPTIFVKLNEQNATRRMILSDGVHEYCRTVTDDLAFKFRSIYLSNLEAQETRRGLEERLNSLDTNVKKLVLNASLFNRRPSMAVMSHRMSSSMNPSAWKGDPKSRLVGSRHASESPSPEREINLEGSKTLVLPSEKTDNPLPEPVDISKVITVRKSLRKPRKTTFFLESEPVVPGFEDWNRDESIL